MGFEFINNSRQEKQKDIDLHIIEVQSVLGEMEKQGGARIQEILQSLIEKAGQNSAILKRWIPLTEITVTDEAHDVAHDLYDHDRPSPVAQYVPGQGDIYLYANELHEMASKFSLKSIEVDLNAETSNKNQLRRIIFQLMGDSSDLETWDNSKKFEKLADDELKQTHEELSRVYTKIFSVVCVFHEEIHALTDISESSDDRNIRMGFEKGGRYILLNEAVTEMLARELARDYLASFPPKGVSSGDIEYLINHSIAYRRPQWGVEQIIVALAAVAGVPETVVKNGMYREFLSNGKINSLELIKSVAENLESDVVSQNDVFVAVDNLLSRLSGENFSPSRLGLNKNLEEIIKLLPAKKQVVVKDRYGELWQKYNPNQTLNEDELEDVIQTRNY